MFLKHNLLILGSRNSNPADQKLKRNEIRPVQILQKNGSLNAINFFNHWGDVGVSSMAWQSSLQDEIFVSVNNEIRRLNFKTGEFNTLDISNINDLHDINIIDDSLWISNTEKDEIIEYDVKNNRVIHRISLDRYRDDSNELPSDAKKAKDRFHCNQIFKNYDDDLCVLIHHVSGWQYYRILIEKLVKNQGDGGVINLDKEKVIPLKLQSPHSLRMINENYWVQDSGDFTTKIYNKEWQFISAIKNGGFGRGVDFSESDGTVYIGLSATRKRYLKIIPFGEYHLNRILMIDLSANSKSGEIPVYHIEQLDNVYILNEKELELFRKLDKL